MSSFAYAREELSRLTSRPLTRAALVVMLAIPLLYGALYLWAFWDPYGRLDSIPVALVNLDQPARAGDRTLTAGADLSKELLDKGTFQWHEVSAQSAAQGVASGRYYSSLTIPRGFSAALASADSSAPVRAQLDVVMHESKNMIAAQIENRVFSEVRAAASASASRGFYDNVFIGFDDVRTGMAKAASGSRDLAAGLSTARSGSSQLADGAGAARAGGVKLETGLSALRTGAGRLAGGAGAAAKGADRLAAGSRSLAAGAAALDGGVAQVAGGASTLASGLATLDGGSTQLASSAKSLAQGSARVDAGVAAAQGGIAQAAAGAAQVNQGAVGVTKLLAAYAAAHPEAATDPLFAKALGTASVVSAGSGTLAGSLSAAQASAVELGSGAHALAAGADQLAAGADRLAGGVGVAASGARELAAGATRASQGAGALVSATQRLGSGASQVASGTARLAAGSSELASGIGRAHAGAASLASGLSRLDAGATDLTSGLGDALSGSRELASGLTAGVRDIPSLTTRERDARANMMSDPVALDTARVGEVRNYGTGFAPYFVPLALWVGALIVFLIISPLPEKAVRSGSGGVVVALAGLWPALLIALGQSVLMFAVLLGGLGLNPVNPLAFLGMIALTACVYAAVMQLLSGAFGPVGKLMAIVILMLQLTSAAGSFPLETLPGFFRAVSPWLPMTYAVAGLREAVSGGDMGVLAHSAAMLSLFAVGAFALSAFSARRARTWDPARLAPTIQL